LFFCLLAVCFPRFHFHKQSKAKQSKAKQSKASKTTHKIFKIYGLAGEALLFFSNFFFPKVILLNLQVKSHGLVGNFSIYVTDAENWHLDSVGVFQQVMYGARYV